MFLRLGLLVSVCSGFICNFQFRQSRQLCGTRNFPLTSLQACGSCSEGLVCACLALNRGLRICAVPNFLTPPEAQLTPRGAGKALFFATDNSTLIGL